MNIPNNWEVIEYEYKGTTTRKVFATWRGGFASSDNWQLNSGIVSTDETDDYYDFNGASGSVYRCYKNREGIRGMWLMDVLNGIVNKLNAKPICYTKEAQ
jgi:hypothetical protein